ncbi:efflux transporter outer membrane subunit [Pantoea sp. Ap-967]|uniref:efflux transporter outer membrane subunit n=1 Tax=Pantoea sp. Ap-967 TaxID=2608362 RepID=UPI001420ED5C|nr:efflux transporter outer membrane subunit [Pantoea sp. Ap-967]NIE78204.1 efflux transporter outer membrane subunit [Pantoea sp. Ap-967]
MTLPSRLNLLTVCLCLTACSTPPTPAPGIATPLAWQSGRATDVAPLPGAHWWKAFSSPELDHLIERALSNAHDLAAATARVRQAQARAVVAGASLLPELQLGLNGNRQHLLHGEGNDPLDVSKDYPTYRTFDLQLTASYELDFWGGLRAARASALHELDASRFDRQTVELTLVSAVADSYLQGLALQERLRIARLNLSNARNVLDLIQARRQAGSATQLELAQQRGLVASQERQLPLLEQQWRDSRLILASLLGDPLQALPEADQALASVQWPAIGSGVPSDLLRRRPDIAAAEARLAAAHANVQVAQAALLPKITLGAALGTGATTFAHILDSSYSLLTAGLVAPVFNNGRLRAERELAEAEQQELLENYRGSILAGFADVEKALNTIEGVDRQRQWQDLEVQEAGTAFDLAEQRYGAGAETLLTVLETQRTLYAAQDQQAQLRLARLQGSVALYKALGGGWQVEL